MFDKTHSRENQAISTSSVMMEYVTALPLKWLGLLLQKLSITDNDYCQRKLYVSFCTLGDTFITGGKLNKLK